MNKYKVTIKVTRVFEEIKAESKEDAEMYTKKFFEMDIMKLPKGVVTEIHAELKEQK